MPPNGPPPTELEPVRDACRRELFVFTSPEIARSCLLAVPDYDDAAKFITAMRGWHSKHGSFLSERWVDSKQRSCSRTHPARCGHG